MTSKKPADAKGKTAAKADALIKGAKKGVELKEHELEQATGGVKTHTTDGIGSHTGANSTGKHLSN